MQIKPCNAVVPTVLTESLVPGDCFWYREGGRPREVFLKTCWRELPHSVTTDTQAVSLADGVPIIIKRPTDVVPLVVKAEIVSIGRTYKEVV